MKNEKRKRAAKALACMLCAATVMSSSAVRAYAYEVAEQVPDSAIKASVVGAVEDTSAETAKQASAKSEAVVEAVERQSAESSLQKKLDRGGTVKLNSDMETTGLTVSTKVTLDMKGHKLIGTGTHTITVTDGGELTIIGNGTVDNIRHGRAALYIEAGGSATVETVKLSRSKEAGFYDADSRTTNDGGNSWYTVYNEGELDIQSGIVESTGNFSSLICNKGKLEISGGNMSNGFIVIKNEGELSVTGGIIMSMGAQGSAICNYGSCEILGGEIGVGPESSGAVPLMALSGESEASVTRVSDEAKLTGKVSDASGKTIAVIVGNEGKEEKDQYSPVLEISGGQILGDIVATRSASVSVTGGKVSGDVRIGNTTKSVNISGGSFSGQYDVSTNNDGALTVEGGSFDKAVENYVAGSNLSITVVYSGKETKHYVGEEAGAVLSQLESGDCIEVTAGKLNVKELCPGVGVYNNGGEVKIGKTTVVQGEVIVTGENPTLQSILNAASARGGRIVLKSDYQEDVEVKSSVTIDLNGHKLTNVSNDTIRVAAGGNLTLTGEGVIESTVRYKSALHNEATTTISSDGVKVIAAHDTLAPVVFNSGNLTMTAGEVQGSTESVNPAVKNEGRFEMTGGKITNNYIAVENGASKSAVFENDGGVIDEVIPEPEEPAKPEPAKQDVEPDAKPEADKAQGGAAA